MEGSERLRDALAKDRFLAVATLVLALITCAPLSVTSFVPLNDLPGHVGAAELMKDVLRGGTVAAEHYRVQWLPVPYWVLYGLLAIGSLFAGPLLAAKMVVALAIVVVPVGMMRLALALGRDPRLGLVGFALAWNNNMMWGFVAYELGLGLAFVALASFARARTLPQALGAGGWSVLVALTHAQSFGILALLGGVLVGRPARLRERPLLWLTALGPGVLALVPWILSRMLAGDGGGGGPQADWIGFHTWTQQFDALLSYSTGILYGEVALHAGKLAFVSMLSAPVLASAFALRRSALGLALWCGGAAAIAWCFLWPEAGPFRTDVLTIGALTGAAVSALLSRGDRNRRVMLLLLALSAGLYFGSPMGINWPIEQWYIYPRHAVLLLALAAITPPLVWAPPSWEEQRKAWIARQGAQGFRVLSVLPGMAAAVLLSGVAVNQFAAFAERAEPFREIIGALDPEPRLLTLMLQNGDPSVPYHPFNQFHSYAVAARGGYDPFLFDNPSTPFVHTVKLPHPAWNQMHRFDLAAHGPHYDHILVQGPDILRNRTAPGLSLEKVRSSGMWTLYRVREEPAD